MALVGKRLRWYFNVGGETAQVMMNEDVKANGNFNSVVLERYDSYKTTEIFVFGGYFVPK